MDLVRLVVSVVSLSVIYCNSMVVDMLNVVMKFVMFATNVSTISCDGPAIAVVKLMLLVVVAV